MNPTRTKKFVLVARLLPTRMRQIASMLNQRYSVYSQRRFEADVVEHVLFLSLEQSPAPNVVRITRQYHPGTCLPWPSVISAAPTYI